MVLPILATQIGIMALIVWLVLAIIITFARFLSSHRFDYDQGRRKREEEWDEERQQKEREQERSQLQIDIIEEQLGFWAWGWDYFARKYPVSRNEKK